MQSGREHVEGTTGEEKEKIEASFMTGGDRFSAGHYFLPGSQKICGEISFEQ